ncbi:MAG: hypothetical protein DSY90_09750 [Deltaproteobacteria bacterium]|nr:MAG: hypothetical protein DSY90_09750 [Deltaproteobacteria bacterium]RUA01100.1 MAG: hypothetical protein DSY89_05450 [Deltaproteobacteria bacterium]
MTSQVHENLILDGKKTSMAFCPPLPENDARVAELPDGRISGGDIFFSTACWRQYIGTWEIRDNKFYLVKLKGKYRLKSKTPVLAEWFTGTLRIPRGKILEYVHMGYGSVYEKELHIKIRNGIVIKTRTIDNRNKDMDKSELMLKNLPGFENRFDGDDEL